MSEKADIFRTIKRCFTHPYGTCRVDSCDEPRLRWMDWCNGHWNERIRTLGHQSADFEFERDVRIQVEALRRVRDEELADA